jgi:hypothetical protein
MSGTAFDKPVVLCLADTAGTLAHAELHDPSEAIAAMSRPGLDGFSTDPHVWTTTLMLLARADSDPTPQNLRVAQLALEVLASEVAMRH